MTRPAWQRVRCEKCNGTGHYLKHGPCYQCEGKGHVTEADDRRCQAYWTHRFASELRHSCNEAQALDTRTRND